MAGPSSLFRMEPVPSAHQIELLLINNQMITPQHIDILCGKEKSCVNHVGSRRFRAIIETYRVRYQGALTKYDKMMITKEIYESLCLTSCRFLKFNEDCSAWEELSPMAARDKVCSVFQLSRPCLLFTVRRLQILTFDYFFLILLLSLGRTCPALCEPDNAEEEED